MSKIIQISSLELEYATIIGTARDAHSRAAGLRHSAGFKGTDQEALDNDIMGAAGEIVAAKFLGCYYFPTIDTFKTVPDVGPYEVRCSKKHELVIRPNDPDDRKFVCTVKISENEYKIYDDFMYGYEAKKKKHLFTDRRNKRPKAFFIPCFYLEIDETKTLIKDYKEWLEAQAK